MRKFLVLIFSTAILVGVGSSIVWLLWLPNTPSFDENHSLHIPRGSSFTDIVDSLESRKLINNLWSFRFVASTTGWNDQIKAGHYAFSSKQSNVSLLQTLRKGLQTPVSVRIPSGSRRHRMARIAASNMAFEPEDFLAALGDTALASSLNTDTLRLFSYMLPETYQFYWLTEAKDVVRRIKNEFDAFYEHELASEAAKRGLTHEEVVSLAAIVEWETNVDAEKSRVAGVYLNRLRKRWPLQADPTVQYALIEMEGHTRRLFYRDYRIRHLYNTYLYQGLPPSPITNPSPSSLRATAAAEEHNYMFFVANPEGGHSFNVDLRSHNQDAATLRRHVAEQRRKRASL
ncbi:MAG: endolytic transglycosylase MltG [Bacteroidetes bacterium]|nr:endolytic transglycosylase MltG [Bacteroidota bacterium]